MRTFIFCGGLWLLLLLPFLSNAQEDSTLHQQVYDTASVDEDATFPVNGEAVNEENAHLEWNGYFMTDDRLRLEGGKLNWQEYRLDFRAQYRFADRAKFFSEVWVRGIRTPGITQTTDLMFSNKVMPVELDLREAYVDLYGLFTRNLDVRIGRQRIAWGTGDRLNPTDNLNPYDLEDIWDFGRHSASNALQLNYYAGKWTFTGIGILNFSPAVLPGSDWTPAFMPEATLPGLIYDTSFFPGVTVPVYIDTRAINDSIVLPARDIRHAPSFGFKVKRSVGAWDLSLSYVYNRESLPSLEKTHIRLTVDSVVFNPPLDFHAQASATVDAQLKYAAQKVIGFDFAGSLFGIGLRGEAACFIPERQYLSRTMRYEVPLLSMVVDSILPDSLISDGKPYVKFLVGADYTFRHNIYLNFQYLHGFLHEKGKQALNDYFVLGLDWTILNSKLKLSLLNTAVQISDWKNVSDSWAVMYLPEIRYYPVDNAEFSLGAHIIEGSGNSGFGRVTHNDDLFIRFKYSF